MRYHENHRAIPDHGILHPTPLQSHSRRGARGRHQHVRAAADDFNEQRKGAFIRELAAEGFIADRYQWYSGSDSSGYSGVTWIIDRSWLASTPALMRRKALPWIAGMFAGACVMLLLLMSIVIARHG